MINWRAMTHPLEAIIREAYDAFGRGDIDGYLRNCVEDFAFHIPGNGGISGKYVGKRGLHELARKTMSSQVAPFRKRFKPCWPTTSTQWAWHDIGLLATLTSTRSERESSLNASGNPAIPTSLMMLGGRENVNAATRVAAGDRIREKIMPRLRRSSVLPASNLLSRCLRTYRASGS